MNTKEKINWRFQIKIFRNVAILIAICALMLVGIEASLRFTSFYDKFVMPKLYPIWKHGHMVYDEEAGYDLPWQVTSNPYWIRDTKLDFFTNELSINDKPYQGEKDYVLLLGDSFTWAYGPWENKFGTILERDLGVRVLKAGVSGYGTAQQLVKAKKIVRKVGHAPRLIIVGYLTNDFMDDHVNPYFTVVDGCIVTTTKNFNLTDYTFQRRSIEEMREGIVNYNLYGQPDVPRHPWIRRIYFLVSENTVMGSMADEGWRVFKEQVWAKRLKKKAPVSSSPFPPQFHAYTPVDRSPLLRKAWDRHLANLKAFKDFADAQGSDLLIAMLPMGELVYDCLARPTPDQDFQQPYRIVQSYCAKNGIKTVNLAAFLRPYADQTKKRQGDFDPNVDFYWKIDGHLSSRGNKMTGHLLANYVKLFCRIDGKED